jgi:hypothetical protein
MSITESKFVVEVMEMQGCDARMNTMYFHKLRPILAVSSDLTHFIRPTYPSHMGTGGVTDDLSATHVSPEDDRVSALMGSCELLLELIRSNCVCALFPLQRKVTI